MSDKDVLMDLHSEHTDEDSSADNALESKDSLVDNKETFNVLAPAEDAIQPVESTDRFDEDANHITDSNQEQIDSVVQQMGQFEHGGHIHAHPGVTDFSASINPLGMPEKVGQALAHSVHGFSSYPDPRCTALCSSIASFEGIDSQFVICTAGATDLMARIVLALHPKHALVAAPCYAGYEEALAPFDCTITHHYLQLEDCFAFTERFLEDISPQTDLVIIANPNNPTGLCINPTLLYSIIEQAAACNAVVVCDESFIAFTDSETLASRVEQYPNLVVMKTLTKSHALAGLRVGYGICADSALLSRLKEVGQPWVVSTPAQVAGIAALQDLDYLDHSRAYIQTERQHLLDGFANLGLYTVTSEANFVLFRCEKELYAPLLERAILIRRCENLTGLDKTWYRAAVRTTNENDALLSALGEIIA